MTQKLSELQGKYKNNIPGKIIFTKKGKEKKFELGDPPSKEAGTMAQVIYNAKKTLHERYLNICQPTYTKEERQQALSVIAHIQRQHDKYFDLSGHSALFNIDNHTSLENIVSQEAHKILSSNCIDVEEGIVNDNLLIKSFEEINFDSFVFRLSPDTYVQIVLAVVLFVISLKIQSKQNIDSNRKAEKNFKRIEMKLNKLEEKLEEALKYTK